MAKKLTARDIEQLENTSIVPLTGGFIDIDVGCDACTNVATCANTSCGCTNIAGTSCGCTGACSEGTCCCTGSCGTASLNCLTDDAVVTPHPVTAPIDKVRIA